MRAMVEALRSAAVALRANMMRSLLTALGIIIGVSSVILMVAVGEGARVEIEARIASMGTNLLQLRPGSSRVSGRSAGADTRLPFSEGDIEDIKGVAGVEAISGHLRRSATAIYGTSNWLTNIDGVHGSYLTVRDWELSAGRFFTEDEYRSGARTAIVGATVAQKLGIAQGGAGSLLRIGSVLFDVIGTLEAKGADAYGKDQDDVILIPLSTIRARMIKRHKLVADQVGYVTVKIVDDDAMQEAREAIQSVLRRNRGAVPGQSGDRFEIRDLTEYLLKKTETQQTLSLLLAVTATISLIVGGIGIMNIMLVSVTERTREIGLRLAVGARRFDIRFQFLSEAVMLCLVGGAIGTAIGILSAVGVAHMGQWPIVIGPSLVFLALGSAALTGIGFGLLPAQRAANLNPIEALRSE